MPEELPRRYVTIRRRYDGKRSGPISAVVWDSVPGRPDEAWLTHVRPVVRLSNKEDGHVYGLIGAVHAALEGAGLLSRAQRFVGQGTQAQAATSSFRCCKEGRCESRSTKSSTHLENLRNNSR